MQKLDFLSCKKIAHEHLQQLENPSCTLLFFLSFGFTHHPLVFSLMTSGAFIFFIDKRTLAAKCFLSLTLMPNWLKQGNFLSLCFFPWKKLQQTETSTCHGTWDSWTYSVHVRHFEGNLPFYIQTSFCMLRESPEYVKKYYPVCGWPHFKYKWIGTQPSELGIKI